ncbi:hypothetical protein IWW57_002188, partial [Coemansia sp. S610]
MNVSSNIGNLFQIVKDSLANLVERYSTGHPESSEAKKPEHAVVAGRLKYLLVNRQPREEFEHRLVKGFLELNVGKRSSPEELVSRGLLKDTDVAPTLQAKKLELERSLLVDRMEHLMANRQSPEEFEPRLVKSHLQMKLGSRSPVDKLIDRGILQSDNFAPFMQAEKLEQKQRFLEKPS